MENRFYIKELDSYQKASDLSKERMGTNPNYDLELLFMIWNASGEMEKKLRKKT